MGVFEYEKHHNQCLKAVRTQRVPNLGHKVVFGHVQMSKKPYFWHILCSSQSCSCKSYNLSCIPACGNCHGMDCANSANVNQTTHDEEDEEGDG